MSTHKRADISGIIPRMGQAIDKVLSDNLQQVFRKQGITSAVKAETALKVPRSTIDRVLNARASAKLETLAEIAEGLKLEAWQLLVPGLDPDALPVLQDQPPKERLISDVLAQAQYADLWKINASDLIKLISEFAMSTSTGRMQILRMAEGAEKISSPSAEAAPANE